MKGRWTFDRDPRVRELKAQLAQTRDPGMRQKITDELEAIAEDILTEAYGGVLPWH